MKEEKRKSLSILLPQLYPESKFPFHNGLAMYRPNQLIEDPGLVMEGELPSPDYVKTVHGSSYSSGTNGIFPDAQGMSIEQKARLMKNPWLALDPYPHDSVMPASK